MQNNNNKKVDWKTFTLIVMLMGGILGIIWNTIMSTNNKIEQIKSDIAEIKIDTNVLRADLNNLINRIDTGEVSIRTNDFFPF